MTKAQAHPLQPLRDLSMDVPACAAMTDEAFFAMLDSVVNEGDDGPTDAELVAKAQIATNLKGEPKWDAFIAKVIEGPTEDGRTPEQQLTAWIKKLPANEREAAKALEDALLG